ncbi:unnamed protein product [Arctia plantaginis]|uniref:Uncharacterized protein n=1 Tax=Arctia plantaginis TaxID=874455 RepID=A0A8S0Z2T0_ARCPL|nr:unnamed protein product [Arctia plantaginis]
MNKLFIILLAIGLASAHTFVKRDAPATATSSIESYIETAQKQLQEAFDPEVIKKNFNDIVDKVADAAKKLKPEENKQKV